MKMNISDRLYLETMDKSVRKSRAKYRGEHRNKGQSRGVSKYNTTHKPYGVHVNLANEGRYGTKQGLYNSFTAIKATLAPLKPYLKQKIDYIKGKRDTYFSPSPLHSYA